MLIRKLDVIQNGDESMDGIKKWKEIRKKKNREKKSRRKYRRLDEDKAGKDNDDEGDLEEG